LFSKGLIIYEIKELKTKNKKLKCLKSTWFDSDFNESGTYETKFSVDGSEYLYYDYSDYHS